MPGRQDDCQLVPHKGHGADILMLGLIFDKADVDGIVQHPALDEGGIVDLRFRPHLRKLLLEAVQQLRQDMGADGDAGADAQGADAVPVFDAGLHLVKE